MTKRLLLTTESSTQEWELPRDTDVTAVRENIMGAMTGGAVVEVPVRCEGDPATTLLIVNGRMLVAAAVVETHEISS